MAEMYVHARERVVVEGRAPPVAEAGQRSRAQRRTGSDTEAAVRESAESFAESAECCERLRVDAVWTVDGGRRWVQEDGRRGGHRASRAAVTRHCGLVESGRIVAVPVESHGAEMDAVIAALTAEREAGGRRPLLLFDSTSPPEALARFRDMHDRRRAGLLNVAGQPGVQSPLAALVHCWGGGVSPP